MDGEGPPILITLPRILQSMSEAQFQICYSLDWAALDKNALYPQPVFCCVPFRFLASMALEFCGLNLCHCHKCTAISQQHEQCILNFDLPHCYEGRGVRHPKLWHFLVSSNRRKAVEEYYGSFAQEKGTVHISFKKRFSMYDTIPDTGIENTPHFPMQRANLKMQSDIIAKISSSYWTAARQIKLQYYPK